METLKIIEIIHFFIRKYIVDGIEDISFQELYQYVKEEYWGKYISENEVHDILNYLYYSSIIGIETKVDKSIFYRFSALLEPKKNQCVTTNETSLVE